MRFVVGDKLPLTLSREELAEVIGKSLSQFDALRRTHEHPAIKELLPRVGHPRFCGKTAQAWIDQREQGHLVRYFKGSTRAS